MLVCRGSVSLLRNSYFIYYALRSINGLFMLHIEKRFNMVHKCRTVMVTTTVTMVQNFPYNPTYLNAPSATRSCGCAL